MARVEDLTPRRFLPTKCCLDGTEPATKTVKFDFGWELSFCAKHLQELKAAMEHTV